MYCRLLKRMQLTFTAWVESCNTGDDDRRGGDTDPVKNVYLCRCMTFLLLAPFAGVFVCNKPKVKFMHNYNRIEHYIKELYYLARAKHDCT